MEDKLWEQVAVFHGHKCPGLAIGYKVSLLALKHLDIKDDINDEDIVCIAETDACGVDAVQVILKATTGTGAMRILYTGKQAFNIFNRKNGKKARFVLNNIQDFNNKEDKMKYILSTDEEKLFTVKDVKIMFPEKAQIYNSYICSECGEKTAENAVTIINNKYICNSCKG
ncbi:FmdE family protein [Mucispirillum schaedleri]|jgi:formylmethanofuran dehydrogenase subunit E|uniref:Formylmethanofuran dehydrogenase subunit E domain-containing protein n=1 Tax=Mucispirillum schaedleri ASF457 TaxID=1379858 RepID=V2PX03_9BACT|nr:FmdE family protein [Mucispirillum schaedleri]MCX4361037.1 FmdE family protein [Mucispirillum schaedleri]USF23030.1 hypothetical protein N508_000083 [Mucispirillum schaedleri ASF457]SIW07943.1 conserved hypothetical protein [Mucispirillum schaedleri ASF457]